MTIIKIKTTATEAVKELFTIKYGFEPTEILNNGTFYWADQIGFSSVGKFVMINGLCNGK